MTGPRSRRLAAIAALLIVVGAGAAMAQQAPGPFFPNDKTYCGPCHRPWTPPLRPPESAIVAIIPPATLGAPIGTEFNYTVKFQQAWNPKPAVPELQYIKPVLDLSAAPSLRFGGGPPDITGLSTHFRFVPDAKKPTQPQENVSNLPLESGATYLKWTLNPTDTSATGTDLALLVTPPGSNATLVIDDNHAAGSSESIEFQTGDPALVGGNWSVGIRVRPTVGAPDPANPGVPTVRNVEYDIVQDAKFDTASLRVLAYPKDVVIKGGGAYLQNWRLKFVQEPAAGEEIRLHVNTTVYYEHQQPQQGGDYANFAIGRGDATDHFEPMAVPLGVEGGQPVLRFETSIVSVRPVPLNGATMTTISEAVGYASAFLVISSIVSGGMFGQASRRGLNTVFLSAKRRVAYHNFLSYGLSVAALVHMAIFLIPMIPGEGGLHRPSEQYQWTLGIIWGSAAMLAMVGLGVTGAFQVPMIRRWNYGTWKWWHYGLTIAVIVFTIVHILLDGAHFPDLQEAIGWKDPFYNPVGGVDAL